MTHFGIICPPLFGHLNPITALGRELQRRGGHQVIVLGMLEAQPNTLGAGLGFWAMPTAGYAYAESEYPPELMAQVFVQLGKLNGLAALRYTVSFFKGKNSGARIQESESLKNQKKF
ncbi:MAG: hypothetical protein KME30_00775 [Iphinoe sp. HA4291-MV1]|jgi:UDP:flavonoid glycosyltransferase YjiC (YdhE family)|nr:hypothetical protein [Iphinoe sp. HA4291-MV1]